MVRAAEVLGEVAPGALPNYARAFEAGDAAIEAAGLTTPLRLAHFLAQVLAETDGASVLREDLDYTSVVRLLAIFGAGQHSAAITEAEAPGLLDNPPGLAERVYGLGNPGMARRLGNVAPGDGWRFRGGGLLQTTGGANYRAVGTMIGADLAADPWRIGDPGLALAPALAVWRAEALNQLADRGDLPGVTRAINGGANGLDCRRHWLGLVWAVLGGDDAWRAAAPDEATAWVQQALDRLGVVPRLLVDGVAGPATAVAVRWFQARQGLVVDGVAGAGTRAALRGVLMR